MKKLKVLFILLLCQGAFLQPANAAARMDHSFADIVEPLMPAVVNVYTYKFPEKRAADNLHNNKRMQRDPFADLFEKFGLPNNFHELQPDKKSVALGSGFIIDPKGYIVTNHHVIEDADEVNIKLNNKKEYKAEIIGSDAKTDLALLKVKADEDLPFVKFGDSNISRVGDWVIAIGNPFGLGGTVTAGIISSKARDIDHGIVDDYLQTDAAINSGNSGGPMFNLAGEVIGINTAIGSTGLSTGNVGIGFAIPSSTAKDIIAELKNHGKVSRGMLLVRIQDVTEEIAESLGLKEAKGALIVDVEAGGPGEMAGLQPGDIVIEYQGTAVEDKDKLYKMVARTPVNTKIKLVVLRKSKRIELNALLKEVDNNTSTSTNKDGKLFGSVFEYNGVKIANLNKKVRDYFSIPTNIEGVIVESITKTSPWHAKGIMQGDVITAMNQVPIKTVEDVEKQLLAAKNNKKKNIFIQVFRENNSFFVAVPLQEGK